jgi:putative nucleotidyltransferase with HDIG domain
MEAAAEDRERAAPHEDAVTGEGDEFFPVPLAIMRPGTLAPVNLYIGVGHQTKPNLYKSVQTPLTDDTRERLLERDVRNLLVRKEDEDVYYQYVEEHISDIIKDDLLPSGQASKIIYVSSSRVMADVLGNPRSGRSMQRVQNMVEGTVLAIMKTPDALWQMTAIASHDYYTYTHCVNVGMFLVALCRNVLHISDVKQLERIGLGAMLHDVGKSEIPDEILNKPGRLTPEEFELIQTHPQLGVEIVSGTISLPPEAGRIILSHHERWNGTGYPDGIKGESISKVVRLSTICDVYDALTTRRSYADARDAFHALSLMLNEMRGHFDESLLHAFITFLGPRTADGQVGEGTGALLAGPPEPKGVQGAG